MDEDFRNFWSIDAGMGEPFLVNVQFPAILPYLLARLEESKTGQGSKLSVGGAATRLFWVGSFHMLDEYNTRQPTQKIRSTKQAWFQKPSATNQVANNDKLPNLHPYDQWYATLLELYCNLAFMAVRGIHLFSRPQNRVLIRELEPPVPLVPKSEMNRHHRKK